MVRIVSGPASGFTYFTFIEPDEEVLLAPIPRDSRNGGFMRVLDIEPLYPGTERYRRVHDVPDETVTAVPFERLSVQGDIIVEYEHVG
jgi:hypothetical protein